MKKKVRLSVYVDPETLAQLTNLAARKQQPKSLIAETAIESFLTPDEADQREAAFTRRVDLLARQLARLERDLLIAVEALALFIRFSMTVTPILPESAAAQAKGRERYESFLKTLGQHLADGKSFLREVPLDRTRDAPAHQTTRPGMPQSNRARP
jgi:predicted transcriptional regulator